MIFPLFFSPNISAHALLHHPMPSLSYKYCVVFIITSTFYIFSSSLLFLTPAEKMSLLMRRPSSSTYSYSKLDKEDPEDVIHRRAQFLIYKTLQQADSRGKPSFLRIRLCRLKVKIGKKLKKLRKSMILSVSAARVRMYKQVANQWKRLFCHGEAIASLPSVLA